MTLEQLKKLCDEATPGPWEYHTVNDKHRVFGRGGPPGQVQICDSVWGPGIHEKRCTDLDFITAARTYMPILIELLEVSMKLNVPMGALLTRGENLEQFHKELYNSEQATEEKG